MVSISTYGGWAGIVIIGAGYWYLQRRRNVSRPSRSTQKQVNRSGDARKEGRPKKQHDEGTPNGVDSGTGILEKSQKRRRKKEKPTNSRIDDVTPAKAITPFDDGEGEDEVDNREFARLFQNAKSGISTARPQVASRQRSVKQSQANDTSTFGKTNDADTSSNEISSNAGIDGDDDLSVTNSPPFGATTFRSGDVSDMLESPTPGPSVLRITEPAQSPQPKNERRPAKVAEMVDTKKQRQHRKKNEERKAALQEDEKERRALMEKQRRTAREAEGRAAKDGSTFMDAKVPTTSPWAATPPKGTLSSHWISTPADLKRESDLKSKKVELLDTFEPNSNVSTSSAPESVASSSKTNREWDQALPSEEEQIRRLEEETAWSTVTSKKGKKKGGESEQVTGQVVDGRSKVQQPAAGASASTQDQSDAERKPYDTPHEFIGDPTIDTSNDTSNGKPTKAVLDNSDDVLYSSKSEDSEWEVA